MSLTHKDDDRLSHDYVKSSKNLLRLYANKENCLVNWSTELGRTYTEKSIIRELLIKKGEWYIILENGPEIPLRKVILIKQK